MRFSICSSKHGNSTGNTDDWTLRFDAFKVASQMAGRMHDRFKAALPMRCLLPLLLEETLSARPSAPLARAA